MIYTITSTLDYASSQELDLIKNGNKYNINLYNKDTKENTSIKLENKEQATSIYLKFVEFIINGLYSYEQRKRILLENNSSKVVEL